MDHKVDVRSVGTFEEVVSVGLDIQQMIHGVVGRPKMMDGTVELIHETTHQLIHVTLVDWVQMSESALIHVTELALIHLTRSATHMEQILVTAVTQQLHLTTMG
jgi:hypothetical protein